MTRAFSFDVFAAGSGVLTVGECAIPTAAQRAHREVPTAQLAGYAAIARQGAFSATLDPLIGTSDFSELGTDHPEMAGKAPGRVRLGRREDDSAGCSVVEPR